MTKKYLILTYGCQMNQSDSGRIAKFLEKAGYKKTEKENQADLIVLNACSVRQSAIDRIYGKINNFLKFRKKPKILLTGCLLSLDAKKLKERADYLLSIKSLKFWNKFLNKEKYFCYPAPLGRDYLESPALYISWPIAYIPISIGCNNFCSYCVVPFTRGREICRATGDIISEVKTALKNNCKEIWLLGQNVNSYQYPNPKTLFPELLKMINDIPGKFWLRFTSPNPKDFSDDLIEAMARCKKVTPYLNLPLQSGNNEILKKMKRGYSAKQYEKLVKKIRKKIPGITLSTDLIVGFPGETKAQFENTEKLFKKIKFDMAYISQYSPRPGTLAFKMKDDVPKEEKKKREKILNEILKNNSHAINGKYLGKVVEVLPTEYKNGFLIGKSLEYKTIKFKGPKKKIGKFCNALIKKTASFWLEGDLIAKKTGPFFLEPVIINSGRQKSQPSEFLRSFRIRLNKFRP